MENAETNTSNFLKLIKITKKLLIILIILSSIIGLYIYTTTNYIIIRFNELGALSKNMSVYYNGFKIGKIVYIGPDKDFKHTLARVNLIHSKIDLPQNTTVKVESFPSGELYLQFIYPQSPSLTLLKRGDVLEGIATYNLEEFMLGQNISGVTDIVSLHVIKALQATEISNQEMQAFFKSTSKLIENNSKSITEAVNNTTIMTKNLAQMAENLNQTSKKINNSLNQKDLNETITNIKASTTNFKNATAGIMDTSINIAKATENIDKTMQKIDDTITNVNATVENVNAISNGLKQTLSQRFAGIKIMFGTPVKPNQSCKTCKQ